MTKPDQSDLGSDPDLQKTDPEPWHQNPWFFAVMFVCVGLLGLFAIKPKLEHREDGLMTRYTSRQEAYKEAALNPDKSIQPMSHSIQKENAAYAFPWEILFVFLLMFTAIICSSFVLYKNRMKQLSEQANDFHSDQSVDTSTPINDSSTPYGSPTK